MRNAAALSNCFGVAHKPGYKQASKSIDRSRLAALSTAVPVVKDSLKLKLFAGTMYNGRKQMEYEGLGVGVVRR